MQISCKATVSDPDGDKMTVTWVFGDGSSAVGTSVQHTYGQVGTYSAFFTVNDGNGHVDISETVSVQIGAPPVVALTPKASFPKFIGGQLIQYSATATSNGKTLPNSAFSWNIRFKHDNHTHPVGNNLKHKAGSFRVPESGHTFAGDTGFELEVTATDPATGLSTSKTRLINPKKSLAIIKSKPCGISIIVNDLPVIASCSSNGYKEDSLAKFKHDVQAPTKVCIGTQQYKFSKWRSSAGSVEQADSASTKLTVSQNARSKFTAQYIQDGECASPIPSVGKPCHYLSTFHKWFQGL